MFRDPMNFLMHARFVTGMGRSIALTVATTLVLGALVAGSMSIKVSEPDIACSVGEIQTGGERIVIRVQCDRASGTVDSFTNHPPTVARILSTGAKTMRCDLFQNASVGNCVIPN